MKDNRSWLALLLALALVRGLIYAAITPPWQAPDETGHFEYAYLIAHQGQLPEREDTSPAFERELLRSLYEWRYGEFIRRPLPEPMPDRLDDLPPQIFAGRSRTLLAGRFSLSYLWIALFIWPFRHQTLLAQLYAARLASVVIELGIVWLAWSIFQEMLSKKQWVVVAMTGFVVFLPQHTFINANVGDGPMAELATCLVLYAWLRLFLRPARRGYYITAILGGTLLGVWAKNTAVFLIPFDIMALVFLLGSRNRDAVWRRRWGYLALGLFLVALVGWGVWQAPSGQLIRRLFWVRWNNPQAFAASEGITFGQALVQTYDSFWAQFGWMSVRVGTSWYIATYILAAIGLAGWFLPWTRSRPAPATAKWLLGGALLIAIAAWLALVLASPPILGNSQGRYLFPVTVPVTFFLVGGWACWLPASWERFFAPGVLLMMAALDLGAASALWPYFYMSMG